MSTFRIRLVHEGDDKEVVYEVEKIQIDVYVTPIQILAVDDALTITASDVR